MPFTTEEGGRLNNYPIETKSYRAKPPTKAEQRNYIILGAAGLLLVSGLIFIAYSASSVG